MPTNDFSITNTSLKLAVSGGGRARRARSHGAALCLHQTWTRNIVKLFRVPIVLSGMLRYSCVVIIDKNS